MKSTLFRAAVGLALVVPFVMGCREEPQIPPPPVTGFNLVHEFSAASSWSEKERIDFGKPEARNFMTRGWANDELWGRTPFVWSLGETSSLRFFLAEKRDITFEMSCWAFVAEGLPSQVVKVDVNGRESGSVELGTTFGPGTEYEIAIPEEYLVQGENSLTFHYAFTAQPADYLQGNTDRRELAVAWDWVRLKEARDGGDPRTVVEGGNRILEMPFWTEITYFLMLQPDSELRLDGLTVEGGDPDEARLEITIEGRNEEPSSMTLRPQDGERVRLSHPISYSKPTITRLTLRSNPGEGSARGGLRVVEPAIITPVAQKAAGVPAEHLDQEQARVGFGRPNVLIYLIDALRADRLGCYGYHRPISPNIDDFAADATVYENFVAQSSWTKSTMGSVFSGMGPLRHGANTATDILPDEVDTLTERIRRLGWETAGFITNGVVSNLFGFDQGFATYVRLGEDNSNPEIHKLSDRLNEEVARWLENRDDSKPFFIYVHASDPHAPYYPREPFRGEFAPGLPPEIGRHDRVTALTQARLPVTDDTANELAALYDAEIAFNDNSFGTLMQDLKDRGEFDSTLVILMSDHGEEFHDHGRWEHGLTLFGEQLHVPLIIKYPEGRWQGLRIPNTVQQVDILPTVLDVVGGETTPELEGRSLLGLTANPDLHEHSPAVISVLDKVETRKVESVIWETFKLIHYLVYDQPRPEIELYDLAADPKETRNMAHEDPVLVGYLKTLLAADRIRQGHDAEQAQLDDEMRSQLEALGYLEN